MVQSRWSSILEKVDYVEKTEQYLARNRDTRTAYSISVNGLSYTVLPGVFAPDIFEDTYFFMSAIAVGRGESFLEIGAGAGVISVNAAIQGASRVTATDINPAAVQNVAINASLHGVSERVRALHGDVYGPLPSDANFDVVFWNCPFIFRRAPPRDDLDRSVFDQDYSGLCRYIEGGASRLKPGGRLMLGFSPLSGHVEVVESLAAAAGLTVDVVARHSFTDGFAVELLHLVVTGAG